jgi:hypothetical protein
LITFAQQLFDEKLRAALDRNTANNIAFVTFYLGPDAINGQQMTRTYRVVFIHKDGKWVKA